MKKGFTLIEVFFSLTVMTTVILGVFALTQQIVSALPLSGQRLIASYLAQEGIEIVRNLRDTNRIKELAWNQGLTGCSLGCEADFTSQSLSPWSSRFLRLDSGFYRYSASGSLSPFQRKITISLPNADVLEVNVEILWSEKGRSHSLFARENLYNW